MISSWKNLWSPRFVQKYFRVVRVHVYTKSNFNPWRTHKATQFSLTSSCESRGLSGVIILEIKDIQDEYSLLIIIITTTSSQKKLIIIMRKYFRLESSEHVGVLWEESGSRLRRNWYTNNLPPISKIQIIWPLLRLSTAIRWYNRACSTFKRTCSLLT